MSALVDTPAPPHAFTETELHVIDAANAANQWGLDRCNFAFAWENLGIDDRDIGPIGLIDIGQIEITVDGAIRTHPELEGCLFAYQGTKHPEDDSIADHAAQVAAIICAKRGGGGIGDEDMDGCCPAQILLYNVWTRNKGLDQDALCAALEDAVRRKLPVVNMSIWLDESQTISQRLTDALAACEAANVVVVAAAGNSGKSTDYWPAAVVPNVIAVAATDPLDRRHIDSTTGSHVFIGAPGENILTVHGIDAYARPNGTSFAAPFVTAAVWLAKRARKGLSNERIRLLLQKSVADQTRPRDEKIGFGRLDMKRLVEVLPTI